MAAAEMAFAGGLGFDLDIAPLVAHGVSATTALFSESNTRFLIEVPPEKCGAFEAALAAVPCTRIGEVTADEVLRIREGDQVRLVDRLETLKQAWQRPLNW